MKRTLRGVALGAAWLFLTTASAFAQVSTAQLSGRVTDQHRALLQGASDTATQLETGHPRNARTDANGLYVLSNLQPGSYQLQIVLPGFRTYDEKGIVLHVATSRVIDAQLLVGVEEKVDVIEGARPLVDVQSSGIRAVVRHEDIVFVTEDGAENMTKWSGSPEDPAVQ